MDTEPKGLEDLFVTYCLVFCDTISNLKKEWSKKDVLQTYKLKLGGAKADG